MRFRGCDHWSVRITGPAKKAYPYPLPDDEMGGVYKFLGDLHLYIQRQTVSQFKHIIGTLVINPKGTHNY